MLPLAEAPIQTPQGRAMFGAFGDCAPDRWGRRLIQRDDKLRAKREENAARSFGEFDYLLGVRDDLRQGALRFRRNATSAFLADDVRGIPHLVELAALLTAADRLERDTVEPAELALLLRGGSSLGGARPKAHVLTADGRVAIAKFPSPANDEWDVIRWEKVALDLARLAGIHVPGSALHDVDGRSVLIVDRFDRSADGSRIGYVSAMTMLEASDGDNRSYLEIAEVIEEQSPHAAKDLEELWRRVAFSVLIRNTDDHLRNHGFLRTSSAGWGLSPAFDLNPDPSAGVKYLSTAINFDDDYEAKLDLLVDVASEFRLDDTARRRVLGDVASAVKQWRSVADRNGLRAAEIDEMSPAFEHAEADAIAKLL